MLRSTMLLSGLELILRRRTGRFWAPTAHPVVGRWRLVLPPAEALTPAERRVVRECLTGVPTRRMAGRDRVRGLLDLPDVVRVAGRRRGRVEDDLRSVCVEPGKAGALGEVSVVADVDADLGEAGLEDRIAEVARLGVELLPESVRADDQGQRDLVKQASRDRRARPWRACVRPRAVLRVEPLLTAMLSPTGVTAPAKRPTATATRHGSRGARASVRVGRGDRWRRPRPSARAATSPRLPRRR